MFSLQWSLSGGQRTVNRQRGGIDVIGGGGEESRGRAGRTGQKLDPGGKRRWEVIGITNHEYRDFIFFET